MEKPKLTRLEKHIMIRSMWTVIKWLFCFLLMGYSIYRMYIPAALLTLAWLLLTSFGCCENGYISRYHYFFRYYVRHSFSQRLDFSNQYESNQYIRIGEAVFTETHLLLCDFGTVFRYSEIEDLALSKKHNLNVVTILLKNKKKYAFNISASTFDLYQKAYDFYRQRSK